MTQNRQPKPLQKQTLEAKEKQTQNSVLKTKGKVRSGSEKLLWVNNCKKLSLNTAILEPCSK